ncbi:hypothetical protein PL71_10725 [Pseudoalteromonas distincta]|uniref:Uncharacterized protein n=1 Tax=Pseudoalteromonas distincta TaxID=77608 RepID=A0ABT9GE97_9GAMM|nr:MULTISPECIES: hypothetical protein [Pseudoalteromonas distincta group]KHM47648.1 hypothetical protein PL71_10725 [Pseudoalteromonas elyakovii]KID40432.1 hypothetical protein QT16_01050 [Pseudoalteromonas distincta]MDP4484208.1 hypothetical protein [Pseudoalteromonas elyakovii]
MESSTSSEPPTNYSELIKTLLSKIEVLVNDNNADEAQPLLGTLNTELKQWCESSEGPSAEQLELIQLRINTILVKANSAKNESSKAIIKHKKSGKAIKAYKASR